MLWSEETLAILRESRALREQLASMTTQLQQFEQRLRVVSEHVAHVDGSGEETPRHGS